MHKIATARPVPAAFGVFWNSSFGPVPCEAYTIDAKGRLTSDDDETAADLADAYKRGRTFLTYEGFVTEEGANGRAIECGKRYSARPLPAGWYFYIGDQLCVVAPAEPAKVEPSPVIVQTWKPADLDCGKAMNRTAHTPGPWHASPTRNGRAFDIGAANGANIALVSGPAENGADEFETNARLIAAAPELLAAAEHLSAVYDAIWVKMSDGEMALCRAAWDKVEAAIAAAKGSRQ